MEEFIEIKDIDILLTSFASLIKELDKVKLVIVGPDDGYLSNLKKQIKELNIVDKVLFPGPLYEMDKIEAYVDADVFVSMRNGEIFGLTLLEALACGKPVICSKEGGIANYINEIAGFAIENDENELKSALIKILTNEELGKSFGHKGENLVNKNFDWSKTINELENIYLESIIENR